MYRFEHHLLNMYVITHYTKYILQLRKHQYLKRSMYFCVKLLLTCLPFKPVNADFILTSILKAGIIEISPLGTVFECHRFYSLHFLKYRQRQVAAAAVLHASSDSGATFSLE